MPTRIDNAREWLARMPEGEAKAKLAHEIGLQAELNALKQPEEPAEDGLPPEDW